MSNLKKKIQKLKIAELEIILEVLKEIIKTGQTLNIEEGLPGKVNSSVINFELEYENLLRGLVWPGRERFSENERKPFLELLSKIAELVEEEIKKLQ
ncbi:MAG: hypothetical protein ACFFC7_16465 [Candidatus Hermodarchaeota archaeon]